MINMPLIVLKQHFNDQKTTDYMPLIASRVKGVSFITAGFVQIQ